MEDHEFAHLLAKISAMLGLCVASVFAFVVVTADSVAIQTALAAPQAAQAASVVLASPVGAAQEPVTAPPPTCTLTATPSMVAAGNLVMLTWKSDNATSASDGSGGTNAIVNGSLTVTPQVTTTYQKTVYGPGGSGTCEVTVEVSPPTD